jgi:hypothetical protein
MPKLKTYIGTTVVLPFEWLKKVNTETSHIQGEVMIIATTKAAAIGMLVAAGAHPVTAEGILRECRVRVDSLPPTEQALVDAGVADQAAPGAYAWRDGRDGGAIVRVDDPNIPIVGIFRRVTRIEDGKRTSRRTVEPFAEAQS